MKRGKELWSCWALLAWSRSGVSGRSTKGWLEGL